MSPLRSIASTGVITLALGAVAVAGTGAAHADPDNGFRTYAAVGSDTTQAVWNGLTNPGKKAVVRDVASYDATPLGSTIQTRAGGPTFLRPTGSGNGVKALSAAWDPNNHVWNGVTLSNADIAFSRSSSRPSVAGNDLTFLPFARDAVSVAIKPADSGTTPANFTTAQLQAIYGGSDDNTTGTGVTYDANSGLPVLNGATLEPVLPQSGSGTRSFFLGAIGNVSLASYVDQNSTIVENDGTALTDPGELVPFSAAQWIAQNNGVQTNTTAGLKLASINGKAPTAGTAPKLKSGPLFGTVTKGQYNTAPVPGTGVFARDTYNVVPTVDLSDSASASQQTLVGKLTGSKSGQLGNKKAQAVIKKYGFGVLSYLGDASQYLSSGFVH